jgi:hypothetical protein
MAVPAVLEPIARVRLVAVLTSLVPADRFSVLLLMATVAAQQQRLRAMWQAAVTIAAHRVPRKGRCILSVFGMAASTQACVLLRQNEVVRCVALAAADPLVAHRLSIGFLVTRRAVAHLAERLARRWVRIVTARAASCLAMFGVIGLNLLMAAGASAG